MKNKFYVSLKVENANVQELIRAFLIDFHKESSFFMQGDNVKLEIVFGETIPKTMIEAISYCEILDFYYSPNKQDNKKTDKKEEKVEYIERADENINISKLEKDFKLVSNKSEKNNEESWKTTVEELPELDEIAKKSPSFNQFITLVGKWLKMNKKQEFFEGLIIASTKIKKVTWKELRKAYYDFERKEEVDLGRKIASKIGQYNITALNFIKIIRTYVNYPFDFNNASPNRVIMECMPRIQEFEEKLSKVDRNKSINERALYILELIGINELPIERRKEILEITVNALKCKNISFFNIFKNSSIPEDKRISAFTTFSKMLSDYVKKFDTTNRLVNGLYFLEELQKIIIRKEELIE